MTSCFLDKAMRRIGACLVLAAASATPTAALAQLTGGTVTVTDGPPLQRTQGPKGHNNRIGISYADCIANDEFIYSVRLANVGGSTLEVWVGPNCTTRESRVGTTASCWKIFSLFTRASVELVHLRAQKIIANQPNPGGTEVLGTVDDCDRSTFGTNDFATLNLHFMLADQTEEQVGTPADVKVLADLIGPPAPTEVKAGVGEERVILSWTGAGANDIKGYSFSCDPKPGAVSTMQADAGMVDASVDASIDGGAGTGGTSGAGAGGATDASTPDSATTDGGGGNPNCPSTALVPGKRAPAGFECGSVGTNRNEGEATGLVNDQLYAVGVAATDNLNNAGPLSQIVCATPQEVDDFFERYRRAGGEGGGGFCAFGAQPAYGAGVFLGLAAAARWLRRRRP